MTEQQHINQQQYKPITGQTLAERQQRTWQACRHLDFTGAISHVTALDFWRVERPERFIDTESIHITVRDDKHRKQPVPGTRIHMWNRLSDRHIRTTQDGLHVLGPEATWALMAQSLHIDELVEVAESLIRHRHTTKQRLHEFVETESFLGKKRCRLALVLAVPGSDSPKETQLRLCLHAFGLRHFAVNYRVPGMASEHGGAVTLDLADPELLIGIEYEGDHHRTDKLQWRRDISKRRQLEAAGWTIMRVTQLDLSTDMRRAGLAFSVAMLRARKTGQPVSLSTPIPWHQLADRRKHLL